MSSNMTNKERFFLNLKITKAVRARKRILAENPVSTEAIDELNTTIKTLEDSLKEPADA